MGRDESMRAFIMSVIVALIVAAGAAIGLDNFTQSSAYQAFSTGGARVAVPGSNLVGQNW
jgi:hypothetical protein